jgi:pimeloyl-ACP methyl ester carboxylesterase
MFVHGWPQLGVIWRAQMDAFAARGWRCVAPDMRGYGGSSAPEGAAAYALSEIVGDMVELHDHLGARAAIWVGHDWGSPVVGAIAAQHAARCRGAVLISVPYFPRGFALANLVPLVDRELYPAASYPDGQWDYYRFYLKDFEQTVGDMEADVPATLAGMFRRGTAASVGALSPSALLTQHGGRYGAARRAPATVPDPEMWPATDFALLVEAFRVSGFRPANSWYLNDAANVAYAAQAPDAGRLHQPVLFVNGTWDALCDIGRSRLGEPMRASCGDLTVTNVQAGHWVPLEAKSDLVVAIQSWIDGKQLAIQE